MSSHSNPSRALGLCAALTLVACPGGEPAAVQSGGPARERISVPGRPNVVLLTLDTLRADHLQLYGYARNTAPRLEELARDAIVFDRALAPMATTLPTHTSIFTGVWPLEHGILANVTREGKRFKQSERLATLALFMQSAGYDTQAFISALPLKRRYGLGPGFAGYTQATGKETNARDTTERVVGYLRSEPQGPFFMWVHYFDPHSPYIPPEEHDVFNTDAELKRYIAERDFAVETTRRTGQVNEVESGINKYDGEIRFMDAQIGRVLDALMAREDWSRTIVIVVGDHGEGLNQHNEPGHGLSWDEQLRVPCFIRVPDVPGFRVAAPISVVDVAPTLLGLLDLPREDQFTAQMSGVDVLDPDFETRPVLSQTSTRQEEYGGELTFALTTERWKFIRAAESGTELLFDLHADPFELDNVVEQHAEVRNYLRAVLDELVREQTARGAEFRAGGTEQVSPADMDALRSMGYGGDDE